MNRIMETGYGYPTPNPANFALGRPEIQLIPDRAKAADLGLDVRDVGFVLEACIDGAFVGEYNDHGDKIDMAITVAGTDNATVEQIGQIPQSRCDLRGHRGRYLQAAVTPPTEIVVEDVQRDSRVVIAFPANLQKTDVTKTIALRTAIEPRDLHRASPKGLSRFGADLRTATFSISKIPGFSAR